MIQPTFAPLIAYPKAWSGSTPKAIRGTPIYLDAANEKELDQFRGKLHRAIVLLSPPRELKALFEPLAQRQTDSRLLALANGDFSSLRGQRGLPPGTVPTAPAPTPAASAPTNPGAAPSPASPTPAPGSPGGPGGPPAPTSTFNSTPEQRAAFAMQNRKWQLLTEEGAGVVLEPGRGDGGNILVSAATLPRGRAGGEGTRGESSTLTPALSQGEREQGPPPRGGSSRGPSPWAADAPPVLPQVVMAVEHYNRIIRMLKKGSPVELEIDVAAEYHTGDLMSFNVVAEIPGTDLADEVVMLGGHFDSWHSGTGATDNAVGCGVALEAVRILQATGLKPRRTIRIALWTGEEQGLLGSKAYVAQHFGRAIVPEFRGGRGGRPEGSSGRSGQSEGAAQPSASPPAAAQPSDAPPAPGESTRPEPRRDSSSGRPRTKYELKPEHAKLSAYFNLDNGTGKIRGVYLQGNEAMRPIFRAWLAPFADMGAATLAQSNTGGTDHLSFDGVGLPGFQFIQDQLEYDTRTHHYSMDVYDRVQADDMKQAAVIMASFVYHAATRDEKLPRKPLQGEVVEAGATTSSEQKPAEAAK
jgi:Zn-dependent M28 family amino/carboxypeptidase